MVPRWKSGWRAGEALVNDEMEITPDRAEELSLHCPSGPHTSPGLSNTPEAGSPTAWESEEEGLFFKWGSQLSVN